MKRTIWVALETQNLNLPTAHGFLGDDGNLIIQNEGEGLAIFTNEKVGIADFVRGANLLHVSGPGEYAGSWRYSGTDKTRGDSYTPYPLIFTKVLS